MLTILGWFLSCRCGWRVPREDHVVVSPPQRCEGAQPGDRQTDHDLHFLADFSDSALVRHDHAFQDMAGRRVREALWQRHGRSREIDMCETALAQEPLDRDDAISDVDDRSRGQSAGRHGRRGRRLRWRSCERDCVCLRGSPGLLRRRSGLSPSCGDGGRLSGLGGVRHRRPGAVAWLGDACDGPGIAALRLLHCVWPHSD